MSVSDWDDDYAKLARAASQLRTTSNNGGGRTNLPMGTREQQADTVNQGLDMLLTKLNGLERTLSPAESSRRRNLVLHLKGQLGGGGGGGAGQQQGGFNPSSASSHPYPGGSGGVQQQQYQSASSMALRRQDDMIDELEAGVGRLKTSAGMIHDESKHHVRLIEGMDANVEKAQSELQAETERAKLVRSEGGSLWRYYAIIAVESILMVLLLFIGAQDILIILVVVLLVAVLIGLALGWDKMCGFCGKVKLPFGAKRAAQAAMKA